MSVRVSVEEKLRNQTSNYSSPLALTLKLILWLEKGQSECGGEN
ncbi:MAG TPA: hypothetical protein VGO45_07260 [Bacteroidia bacterium]|nr:hypothetical protein [Bacteroidia bacterium]